MKRWVGNSVAMVVGVLVGLAAIYALYKYLKTPQVFLDWAVLVFSGIIAGMIGFFVTWGHFQKDPVVKSER